MSKIQYHVIHCSATPEGSRLTFEACRKMHIEKNGWRDIGYNFYIERDGSIHIGRPLGSSLAHHIGYNSNSIATCYEGGIDANGKSKDTRTDAQKLALETIVALVNGAYPLIENCGHRDLSKDLNGDGVITPDEWYKDCPCFDVKSEY